MKEELYRINQKSQTKDLLRFQLCGITFPDKSYMINRTSSPVWCIEYVEEGSGTVEIDGERFFPKEGDSYLLQAGKDHHYYSDNNDPWKKIFVNVSGKLVDSLAEGYGLSNTSHFPGLDIGGEIRQIIEIVKREEMDNTSELIAILNNIFLKMHVSKENDDELTMLGVKMKDFLNTQITSRFHIELLCKHISRSESQTIRLFKKIFGITPYTYVLNKKIGFAKKLLIDTNLSLKEIATKLCFSDEYYFSNIFKEKVGCSPSQYRNSNSIKSMPE